VFALKSTMPALVGQHSHAILRAFVVVSRSIPGWQCGLNLLERRLVDSHTTVIIPFDDRVIFVRLLNCAEFSRRLSEVAQNPRHDLRDSVPATLYCEFNSATLIAKSWLSDS